MMNGGGGTVGKTIGALVLIALAVLILALASNAIFGADNCQPPNYCPPGSGTQYHPEDNQYHPEVQPR
jgi:hypothetical protein